MGDDPAPLAGRASGYAPDTGTIIETAQNGGPATRLRERRVRMADGLALFVREYGSGARHQPAILCLPALGPPSADFDRLGRRLAAKGFRVLCPQYRGHGRSERDPDWHNYETARLAADITQLLIACNVLSAIVLGMSLGGHVALALATQAPGAMAGLVFGDIGPELPAEARARLIDRAGVDRPQADWTAAANHLKKFDAAPAPADDRYWMQLAQETFRVDTDGRLHANWDVSVARPLLDEAPQAEKLWAEFSAAAAMPSLVLRAAASDVLTPPILARMNELHPDLKTATVPDCGHTPTLREPVAERALDGFLARFL